MHDNKKKPVPPAAAPPKPKEQNPLAWLLGFKESEEQKKARETREANEKRSRAVIDNAVRQGALPKVTKKDK